MLCDVDPLVSARVREIFVGNPASSFSCCYRVAVVVARLVAGGAVVVSPVTSVVVVAAAGAAILVVTSTVLGVGTWWVSCPAQALVQRGMWAVGMLGAARLVRVVGAV